MATDLDIGYVHVVAMRTATDGDASIPTCDLGDGGLDAGDPYTCLDGFYVRGPQVLQTPYFVLTPGDPNNLPPEVEVTLIGCRHDSASPNPPRPDCSTVITRQTIRASFVAGQRVEISVQLNPTCDSICCPLDSVCVPMCPPTCVPIDGVGHHAEVGPPLCAHDASTDCGAGPAIRDAGPG